MFHRGRRWLEKRPSLGAGWLRWRDAALRWPLAWGVLTACLLGLGALVTVVKHALGVLARHPLEVLTVTACVAAAVMLRRRRRQQAIAVANGLLRYRMT